MSVAFTTDDEVWADIPGFSEYSISNRGTVFNRRTDRPMRTSLNNYGAVKVTLVRDYTRRRYDKSVAVLVANAFLEEPNILFDTVLILDGDYSNVDVSNLLWRPRWFCWKYTRQLREEIPPHYKNLAVRNLALGIDVVEYNSIVQAGMSEGLLFHDIWRSTYTAEPLFPTGSIFEVVGGSIDI